jgi:superfamily II DNA or RNA helicase
LAIFDEAHHVAAQTIYDLLYRMPNVSTVVGLSASPWRDDGLDLLLEAALGPVRYAIRASDLIDQGWLVPPHIRVHRIPGGQRVP